MTISVEAAAGLVASDFKAGSNREKLELLLEYSENLPALPERYAEHPDLLERVEECQSPVYLFVEVQDDQVGVFFTAPEEAPTTRGFASILSEVLHQKPVSEVLSLSDDFPDQIGLSEAVSPLRIRGMRAMIYRIKRQVREKTA
ncbi:MAG: SufE family protein [Micrococcales bacterium]